MIPALLIKISKPVNSFSILFATFSIEAVDSTSNGMKHILCPSSLSLLQASLPDSSLRAGNKIDHY